MTINSFNNPVKPIIEIDARGPRFGAAITSIVFLIVLATEYLPLLIWQTAVFAIGAFTGPTETPYAWVYRRFVQPRLKGEVPKEDVRPPKFAQLVGFLFALVASIALITDSIDVFFIAASFALAAALLNAVFKICLGCEMYLTLVKVREAIKNRR
jgi:hypothetical protein